MMGSDTLGQAASGLSLIFAAGARPSAADVERVLAGQAKDSTWMVRITHGAGAEQGWLELLASGLTYDLAGLAPGPAAQAPEMRHGFGIGQGSAASGCEAIALAPGPHLAGAGAMIPVVRTMAAMARLLALGLAPIAVGWAPAGSWMEPAYFARTVESWLEGGAFPALGLTGIVRLADGWFQSDGLDHFIGQELKVEPLPGESAADTAKLAARMIDHLVRHGPVSGIERHTGPDSETLIAEASCNGRMVVLRREG